MALLTKRIVIVWVLVLLIASIGGLAFCMSQKCPSCGMGMYFTGETKTEWGKLFYLYECPSSHSYWFPARSGANEANNFSSGPKCPVCGMMVYFTGRTYTEWGKLFKVYKCPSGHESVGQ